MFFGRMEEYAVSSLVLEDDGLGFKKKTWKEKGKARIYIVRTDLTLYQANDLDLTDREFTGYTQDGSLSIGDKVGDMRVTDVFRKGQGYVLYLASLGGEG